MGECRAMLTLWNNSCNSAERTEAATVRMQSCVSLLQNVADVKLKLQLIEKRREAREVEHSLALLRESTVRCF
jgi:hypothetical protein